MDINTFTAAATRVLDQEFSRVSDNLRNGWITPALASLLFEHFGRSQELLLNEVATAIGSRTHHGLPYLDYCRRLNPNHSDTMSAYRTAKPADLTA